MRSLLIKIISTMASFYAAAYLVSGFHIDPTWQSYALTAFVFLVFNLLVTPILKLLLLPINLLTLGLFRWVVQVISLYLFDLFYPGITISSYHFAGFRSAILELPAAEISVFWAYVISALILSLAYNLITSLLQGDSS